MPKELRPMGIACNLSCKYCYQTHVRDEKNNQAKKMSDEDLFKLAEGREFVLFGGEALLTPMETLEKIWKFGFEKYGKNGIQTNGTLITDKHIEIMKKYNVHVGFSIDGPEELNDLRWAGTLEKTRELTKKANNNIIKLHEAGVSASIIITLHKFNASKERLPKFKEWCKWLNRHGVTSARLHLLEKEDVEGDKYALSSEEYLDVFFNLAQEKEEIGIDFDVFRDILKLLKEKDNCTTCIYNGCDPWSTSSVDVMDLDGIRGCGRPHKDNIYWIKGEKELYIRNIALYYTPKEYGGCQGCKYFILCKGQCPGTAIDGDWRNRSEYCDFHYALFEYFEKRHIEVGINPVVSDPAKREYIESKMIEGWKNGKSKSVEQILNEMNTQQKPSSCTIPTKPGARVDSNHIDNVRHVDHLDYARGKR